MNQSFWNFPTTTGSISQALDSCQRIDNIGTITNTYLVPALFTIDGNVDDDVIIDRFVYEEGNPIPLAEDGLHPYPICLTASFMIFEGRTFFTYTKILNPGESIVIGARDTGSYGSLIADWSLTTYIPPDINIENNTLSSPTPTPSKPTSKDNFLLSRKKNKEENFSLLIQEADDLKELCDNDIKTEFKYYADDPDGPGTVLYKMLEKIKIKSTPNCPCKKRVKLMNQLGPEWCEKNLNTIINWLKEESEKRNILFLEPVAKSIIIRAIKISKNKKKNQKRIAKKSFTFKINDFEGDKTITQAAEFKIQSCSYDESPWSVVITFTGCCMRLVSNTNYSITFVAIGNGTVEVSGSYTCGEYLFGDVCVINGETTTSKEVLNCDTVVISWDPTINTCCEHRLDSGPDSELAAFCAPTAMRLKSKTTGKVYLNKNQIIKRIRNFQKRR